MSIDATEAASGECAGRDGRQAKVAPLLAVGLTIRAISAETGIPVGAVHRAKRQIEKARARKALLDEPPPSLLLERIVNGVRRDVRRLTISVYEHKVNSAVRRGLLQHGNRGDSGAVISTLCRMLLGPDDALAATARVLAVGRSREGRGDHCGRQRTDRTAVMRFAT